MRHLEPFRLPSDLKANLCFETEPFRAYFLAPEQFRSVAALVGSVRAHTYRHISPHGPKNSDLDGRDDHYWHLLVWDHRRQALAGSLRMALSGWQHSGSDGSRSYLEHCYPGLDAHLRRQDLTYVEIGRTLVAAPYQRSGLVLMMLLQAMASIPLATGHQHLLGLVSYNHFAHAEPLNCQFLAALLTPPFRDALPTPPPRHPLTTLPAAGDGLSAQSLHDLEHQLQRHFQEPFRVPVLLRRYMQIAHARVAGLSLARDFNQITEILMHCNLQKLSRRQLRRFLIEPLTPVWTLPR
ncbi:MAG: GNAT family N-acetyltransferase [Cyanobium sp.]